MKNKKLQIIIHENQEAQNFNKQINNKTHLVFLE